MNLCTPALLVDNYREATYFADVGVTFSCLLLWWGFLHRRVFLLDHIASFVLGAFVLQSNLTDYGLGFKEETFEEFLLNHELRRIVDSSQGIPGR